MVNEGTAYIVCRDLLEILRHPLIRELHYKSVKPYDMKKSLSMTDIKNKSVNRIHTGNLLINVSLHNILY